MDFGNGTTGRSSWSGEQIIRYPFDFDVIPYEFSIFDTTTDDSYRNTTIEAFFTIRRELIDIP